MVWWKDINDYICTRPDWNYTIEIKPLWDRTLEQNKKYRKILTIASNDLWYSPMELHRYFKFKFLWESEWIPSTKELTKWEFADYLDKVLNTLAEQWILVE